MRLAFILYKYFPFGGLQRDFLRIALACQRRGHEIAVFTLKWEGEIPDGFDLAIAPVHAFFNHRRNERFSAWVEARLQQRPADRVIGFNKMPGLDFYYAADPCFAEKARTLRSPLYRLSARYQHFAAYEQAVFAPRAKTRILMISATQKPFFIAHYQTPEKRFAMLPPGLSRDRLAPDNADEIRAEVRREFGLAEDDRLVLQIGSGFKTKGLDRSLLALAALPDALRRQTRLFAIGQDNPTPFIHQARRLGLSEQVRFFPGRGDIPRVLLAGDLLIHPAYHENTGTVLLEALAAGRPVLTTAVCGYAHYVEESQGGIVLPEPFAQPALNAALADLLGDAARRQQLGAQGLAAARAADWYSMPERAADLILADTHEAAE
ncbi:MAG: glycosyltransferase family 4 protein [Zoogloeaceae bacterium]|jgi:UDP-glucose:(heptosyl)LPS alpha-1,3-glucosyltransferase|nr:glycosyltransferase family 4 protein [Zoogloeaceae bacterium]